MEKETTYRKIAETKYTFTEDDIKWALIAQHNIGVGSCVRFCIFNNQEGQYCGQIVVERTIDLDDSGIVHELT